MATTKRSQWVNPTKEVQLPSGYIVEMRPLGYDLVLKCEHVPDFITSMVVRAFKGEGAALNIDQFKQLGEFVDFLGECCQLCLVHPSVVVAPDPNDDDQITPDMLDFEDKAFIFQTLGKPPRWLDNFRPQQTGDVQTGAEKQPVSDAAEPTAEPEATTAG